MCFRLISKINIFILTLLLLASACKEKNPPPPPPVLKTKPGTMLADVYNAIVNIDGGPTKHISDKNQAIDDIDKAIKLGAIAKRDTDITAALAGKAHFTGLAVTIIAMLPPVGGASQLSVIKANPGIPANVYNAILDAGGGPTKHISDKNQAIDDIDKAIKLGAIAQRDADITAALAGKAHFAGLAVKIIAMFPAAGGGGAGGPPPPPKKGGGGAGAPPPLPIGNYVQEYLDKYLTNYEDKDFGNTVAKPDFGSSPNPLISDAACRDTFGASPEVLSELNFSIRSPEEMLREYLAGQVLTMLGFPTARTCFYKDSADKLNGLYKTVPKLDAVIANQIMAGNNLVQTGGGFKIYNNIFVQMTPSFHLTTTNKWIVAENDYNNQDDFPFLVKSSGMVPMFAYDFQHAGLEVKTFSDNQIYAFNFILKAYLTDEMAYYFIHQLQDFIKDHQAVGTSVLAKLLRHQRLIDAQADFGLNVVPFYNKIKSQIQDLITALHTKYDTASTNQIKFNGFSARQTKRDQIAAGVAQQIPTLNKKHFALSLLGKYHVDNPSDINVLNGLDVKDLVTKEQTRLTNLDGWQVPYATKANKNYFTYPTNKNFSILTQGALPDVEGCLKTYIIQKLIDAGFTNIANISIAGAQANLAHIQSTLDHNATLIIIGTIYDGMVGSIEAGLKPLPDFLIKYNDANKLSLPRYIIGVQYKTPAAPATTVGHAITTSVKSFYKDQHGEILQLAQFSNGYLQVNALVNKPAAGGAATMSYSYYVDALLDFMIKNAK